MDEDKILILLDAAKKAMENAYAPYSRFTVGAALMAENGEIFTGCNVENASYGASVCAERTALLKAVSQGKRDFFAIAVISSGGDYTLPCGICRQVMLEFCSGDFLLVCANCGGEYKEYKLKELIPHGFRLNQA